LPPRVEVAPQCTRREAVEELADALVEGGISTEPKNTPCSGGLGRVEIIAEPESEN
jgi:hypothetical protein